MVKEIETSLLISIKNQQLKIIRENQSIGTYAVSTALNGAGETMGSGCTPRGRHKIRIKIGSGEPVNSVFIGRRPTGEILTASLFNSAPNRDWILTRILWLTGYESGINRGGDCDTLRRYIYIHGTPDSEPMGIPLSHGCIRMRNRDILELYDQVIPGMSVFISD